MWWVNVTNELVFKLKVCRLVNASRRVLTVINVVENKKKTSVT